MVVGTGNAKLTNSFTLGSNAWAAAQKAPGKKSTREELNWLASGEGLKGQGSGQLCQWWKHQQVLFLLCWALLPLSHKVQVKVLSSLLNWHCLHCLSDSLRPPLQLNLGPGLSCFQRLFYTSVTSVCAANSPKISQRSTNPNKHQLVSTCPLRLAKWPKTWHKWCQSQLTL